LFKNVYKSVRKYEIIK